MKNYINPEMELIALKTKDIIITSIGDVSDTGTDPYPEQNNGLTSIGS